MPIIGGSLSGKGTASDLYQTGTGALCGYDRGPAQSGGRRQAVLKMQFQFAVEPFLVELRASVPRRLPFAPVAEAASGLGAVLQRIEVLDDTRVEVGPGQKSIAWEDEYGPQRTTVSGSRVAVPLSLRRATAGGAGLSLTEAPAGERRIRIRQSVLGVAGSVSLPDEPVLMRAGASADEAVLAVLAGQRAVVYGLRDAPALGERGVFDAAGQSGVELVGDTLAVWGDNGVRLWRIGGAAHPAPRSGFPVRGAVATGGWLYCLTTEGLTIQNRDGELVGAPMPMPGQFIAAASDLLMVATEHRVEVFSLAEPTCPVLVSGVTMGTITGLESCADLVTHRSVYLRHPHGTGTILDCATPERPVEAVHYAEQPWFTRTVRTGQTFVERTPGTRELTVLQEARTVVLS
jgi:hypothetical protein